MPNQMMLIKKPIGQHFLHLRLRTSGTVKYSVYMMGAEMMYITLPFQFSGNAKLMPSSSSLFSSSISVFARSFCFSKNLDDLYQFINSSLLIWPSLFASRIFRAFSTSSASAGSSPPRHACTNSSNSLMSMAPSLSWSNLLNSWFTSASIRFSDFKYHCANSCSSILPSESKSKSAKQASTSSSCTSPPNFCSTARNSSLSM
mmetsp:Transcript_19207/g.30427  ORF Transcript_19207/g.30427 Transcript_19207/m.30427 type:complete len:202 (-) Transcript_19207:1080-1685(-)